MHRPASGGWSKLRRRAKASWRCAFGSIGCWLLLVLLTACGSPEAELSVLGTGGGGGASRAQPTPATAARLDESARAETAARAARWRQLRREQDGAGPAFALRPLADRRMAAGRSAPQKLELRAGLDGVRIGPVGGDASWSLELVWQSVGRGSRAAEQAITRSPRQGQAHLVHNRIESRHSASLGEWVLNGPLGIEQGFVVGEPPAGSPDEGALRLTIEVLGLVPRAMTDGQSVALGLEDGTRVARYSDFYAYDAEGRELAVSAVVHGQRIALEVDDARAHYPVEIDPLVWTELSALMASDGAAGDEFGAAVALDADTALVGAPEHDDGNPDSGAAYLYRRDQGEAGTWAQASIFSAPEPSGRFGSAVALRMVPGEETVLIGAPEKDPGGAFYFYAWQSSGELWVEQTATPLPTVAAAGDQRGASVALAGDLAVIGAPGADRVDGDGGLIENAGAAYVLERVGGVWSHRQTLLGGGLPNDAFGCSVAVNGATIVVGEKLGDQPSTDKGAVYLFEPDPDDPESWQLRASFGPSSGSVNQFGASVAAAGDLVLVGAPGGTQSAVLLIRDDQPPWEWSELVSMRGSDVATSNRFGQSVALGASYALVGAPGWYSSRGKAYLFSRELGWQQSPSFALAGAAPSDGLGQSVALLDATETADALVLLGAPGRDGATPDTGVALLREEQRHDGVYGEPCREDAQCSSGYCVDHVCCESACSGDCEACSIWLSGEPDGQCEPIRLGDDPNEECGDGAFCDGNRACRATDGQYCTDASGCFSDHCSAEDQVCCDTDCADPCRSCLEEDTGLVDGVCGYMLHGRDPDGECGAESKCDGAGACRLVQGGPCNQASECLSGHCVDDFCCSSACNDPCLRCTTSETGLDEGQCGLAVDWIGASDGPCGEGRTCSALGQCVWLGGASCDAAADCASGYCIEDVCCDGPCIGTCMTCKGSLKESGGDDGICGPVRIGTDPDGDCAGEDTACGGAGVCKLVDYRLCSFDDECLSGHCVDTGCCPASCSEPCASCAPLGSEEPCVPRSAGSVPRPSSEGEPGCDGLACDGNRTDCPTECEQDQDCVPSYHCDGASCAPARALGAACSSDAQCAGGFCRDGVCCGASCSAECWGCSAAVKGGGVDGECGPVAFGTDPRGDCPVDEGYPASCGADGTCNGAGACQLSASTDVVCAPAECTGTTARLESRCDGMGRCPERQESSCAPYGCGPSGCLTDCSSNEQCAPGNECSPALRCVPAGTVAPAATSCSFRPGAGGSRPASGFVACALGLLGVLSLGRARARRRATARAALLLALSALVAAACGPAEPTTGSGAAEPERAPVSVGTGPASTIVLPIGESLPKLARPSHASWLATGAPSIERARRIAELQRSADAGYALAADSGSSTWRAANATHRFALTLDGGSLRLEPSASVGRRAAERWQLGLRWRRWGRAGQLEMVPLPAGAPVVDGNRLDTERGPRLRESWTNGPLGVEQAFALALPPPASSSAPAREDWLELELELDGLRPRLERGGQRVSLETRAGRSVLAYSDLYARDAEGRWLATELGVRERSIVLRVDDGAARYPIVIDPLVWTVVGALPGAVSSLALGAEVLLVGLADAGEGVGQVLVYGGEVGHPESWALVATLTDGEPGTLFGTSVALEGRTALVGAPDANEGAGAVHVYWRDGEDIKQWLETDAPLSTSCEACAFGTSVGLAGGTAIVGAPDWPKPGESNGVAFLFQNGGDPNDWPQIAELQPTDPAAGARFGQAVSIGEGFAVVGAPHQETSVPHAGRAYVYKRDEAWPLVQTYQEPDPIEDLLLGTSVATFGTTALVGAPGASCLQSGDRCGAAHVIAESSGWAATDLLSLYDEEAPEAPDAAYGAAVALSEGVAAVGAPLLALEGEPRGLAELFDGQPGNWQSALQLYGEPAGRSLGSAISAFGSAVAVANNHLNPDESSVLLLSQRLSVGDPCNDAAACASGQCIDGYCCNTSCSGLCYGCAQSLTGQPDGICATIPVGSDPENECTAPDEVCNGIGGCGLVLGQPCADHSACASRQCVDGYCCNTSCGAKCYGCSQSLTGQPNGTCAPIRSEVAPPGDCEPGRACDGAGQCRKILGQTCALLTECISGRCVDEVCCDSTCTGNCRACSVELGALTSGECRDVPAGLDKDGDCADVPYEQSCDGSGVCRRDDGQSCTSSLHCISGFCADLVCCETRCDGLCQACRGVLTDGVDGACGFVLVGLDPNSECGGEGEICDGAGACKKLDGESCAQGSECLSSFCADDVCCDMPCAGECEGCREVQTGLVDGDGVCAFLLAGTEGPNDCPADDELCGPGGVCLVETGSDCTDDADCATGICMDAVCCSSECAGLCEKCQAESGACAPVPLGEPDAECEAAGNATCDGAGHCLLLVGEPCAANGQCLSDACVDGVCCDSACIGRCVSCAAADTGEVDGMCAAVLEGTDPGGDCDVDPDFPASCGQDGSCDGAGQCALASDEVVCVAAHCDGGSETQETTCSGGACFEPDPRPCFPYACAGAACAQACSSDVECDALARCNTASGECESSATCDGDHTIVDRDDQTTIDCSPYRCVEPAACRTSCTATSHCTAGYACGPDSRCFPAPAVAPTQGADGCSCRLRARPPTGRGTLLGVLLATGSALARRRRTGAQSVRSAAARSTRRRLAPP